MQSHLTAEQETITRLRRIRIDEAQKYLFPISRQKVFPEFGTPPEDTAIHFDGTVLVLLNLKKLGLHR